MLRARDRSLTHLLHAPPSPFLVTQFRSGQFMTDQLSEELAYSQALVAPLLACLQAQSKGVAEAGAAQQPDRLRLLLSNVQLVASIFYSLNSPGLTDVSRGSAAKRRTAPRRRAAAAAPAAAAPAAAAPACRRRPRWPRAPAPTATDHASPRPPGAVPL